VAGVRRAINPGKTVLPAPVGAARQSHSEE